MTLAPALAALLHLTLAAPAPLPTADVPAAFAESHALEAGGDLVGALAAAERARAAGETYDAELRLAWLTLQLDQPERAAAHYARAAELAPRSVDAWLGLARAELARGSWRAAADAGERAVALAPRSRFALRALALARYQLGEHAAARGLYERALAEDPADAVATLGLGFTLARLGEHEAAAALCREAAAALADDPRVADCLALAAPPPGPRVGAAVYGTLIDLSGHGELAATRGVTVSVDARWPGGLGLALLARGSWTAYGDGRPDYEELAPALGVGYRGGGLAVGALVSLLFTNDDATDASVIVDAGVALEGDPVGVRVALAAVRFPDSWVGQVDVALPLRLTDALTLAVGGGASLAPPPGPGSGAGRDPEVSGLARLGLELRPTARLGLGLIGWYGARRYAVEDGGVAVWTSADRLLGGYALEASWSPLDALTLFARWRHEWGEPATQPASTFSALGGTVGAHLTF